MIIKSLHIEGFGVFNDKKLEGFDSGLHLLYGENEAGKSTLLDFIQFTLSGYPRQRKDRRPPIYGGNHGGKIHFFDSKGREWELHHSGDNRSISLFEVATGRRYEDERYFKQLISDANEDIYKNIYAINLQELFDINSIQNSGMKDRIYSLGTGVAGLDLRSLESDIQSNADSFFRMGARTNFRLKELSDEIQALESKLVEISLSAQDYDRLQDEIQALGEEIKMFDEELEKNGSEFTTLNAQLELYPEYLKYDDALKKLAELGSISIIPDAEVGNIKQLLQRKESLLEDLDKDNEEERSLQLEIEKLQINPEFESILPQLESLKKDFINYEFLLKDEMDIQADLERGKRQKSRFLERMGEGFSEEVLSGFRHKLEFRQKGLIIRDRQQAIEAEINRLIENDKTASEKVDELKLQKKLTEDKLLSHSISNEQMANEARERLAVLETKRDMFFRLLKSGDKNFGTHSEIALWLLLAVTVLGGVLIWTTHFILSIILFAVAITAAFLSLFYNKKSKGEEKAADPQNLQLEINKLHDDLKKYEELKSEMDGNAKQLKLSEVNYERIQKNLSQTRLQLEELQEEWKGILSDYQLPLTILPQNTVDTVNNIERFMEMADGIVEQENKLAKVRLAISGFEKKISEILPSTPEQSFKNQTENLIKSLEEFKEVEQKRRELNNRLEISKNRSRNLKERVSGIEKEIETSMKAYELNSTVDFEGHLIKQERYKEWMTIKENASMAIESRFGKGSLTEVVNSMAGLDLMELENRKGVVESKQEELKSERDRKMHQMGQLQNTADTKLNRQEQAELELKMASLKSELQTAYRNWMVARIAGKVVAQCKRKYQDTRQPEVIKRTAEIFSKITEGRYVNLQTEIDKEELLLTEKSGRRKTLDNLSRGTREQLLLSLRMGLIEQYECGGAEPLPVVLDDVLVNFDDKRAATTAEQLAIFAEKRQVFLFTCHSRMRDLMQGMGCKVIEIGS